MPRLKLAFLGVCRALGLFRVSRALTRRRLRIVCYHGFELDDESEFQPKLFIKPDTFAARLDLIERMGFRVLSLDEGVEGLYAGTLPDDALVITIDDGFHSVFARAAKALRERGFPATVYVTTYYVEHPNPVFRLAVQYMFWKSERRALDFSGLDWARAAGTSWCRASACATWSARSGPASSTGSTTAASPSARRCAKLSASASAYRIRAWWPPGRSR